MDLDADFDAALHEAGVAFTERDVALLRAVRDQGSLNKAADALGRSYSRSQQRVVELEEAFGALVDRHRGGAGGGGSTLTEAATELLAEFDRLQTEFTGVTEIEETVLRGTVVETTGELGTVETDAGLVRAIVPAGVRDVRVAVRADAITLHPPESVPDGQTSARNNFRGTVSTVDSGDAVARVTLDVDADADLTVLVTQTSVQTLGLAPGEPVAASFKATATRAHATDPQQLD
jgi:molybdate transport system regulatory protein